MNFLFMIKDTYFGFISDSLV